MEGVADWVHGETGLDDPPVSALELAACCGLTLCPWGRGDAALVGSTIHFPRRARETRQHGLIAHELAHWLLERAGEDDSEDAARYLAGALLLPRRVLDRDLRRRWTFEGLRARHRFVSAEMLARRISQLRSCWVTVFDQGKVSKRWASPGLPAKVWPSALDDACSDGERLHVCEINDPPHHRVIVLEVG